MMLNRYNKGEHARFYSLLSALCVLLFVRYGLQIGVPRILLTGVVVLIALLGERDEILAIAMCCIPLHEAIDFFYALVACAAVYALKYYKEIRINMVVIIALAMIFWELLHCFDKDFSPKMFLVSMIPLITMAVILCVDITDINYAFIVRTMAVITGITGFVLLVNLLVRADFDIMATFSGLRRLGFVSEESSKNTMLGSAVNPNALGIICVIVTSGLLQLRTVNRSGKRDLILMGGLVVFGVLTSSRTFLICLLLMAVLTILSQPGDIYKKLKFMGILVLFSFVIVLLLCWLFPDLLEYYFKRFRVRDITTGRDALMRDYHRFIVNNPNVMFFGIGLQNFGDKLFNQYRVSWNYPHNSIQEIIIAWGIPGLIMITVLCGMLVLHSGKYSKKHRLLNYIPLLIILAKSMAGQLLTSNYTMLALSFAYLSMAQDFRLERKT